LVVGNTTSTD
jgi:hypothetical protein